MKFKKLFLLFLLTGFFIENLYSQIDTTRDILYHHQFLPGQTPKFAIPIVYDFGHVSNILLSTNEEESSISGAINIYSKSKKKDCEECRIGNQIFSRVNLTFPDNEIKKGMKASSYLIELGYRYILSSSASYYIVDPLDSFDLEDTCCLYNYCKSWNNKRAFDLSLDYSFATERWVEYGVTRQNKQYNEIVNSEIKKKNIQDFAVNLSFNFYRKFNNRVLTNHNSNLRVFQYIAFKLNTQIGQYDNLALVDKFYSIDPLASTTVDGKIVYNTSETVVGKSPSVGIAANTFSIIAVGFTDWLSFALTPGRLQSFSSSTSDISTSTLRCDFLFKVPKLEDCDNGLTRNITIGINVKYQGGKVPVYGLGASIPFE